MTPPHIDAATITRALEAWERHPSGAPPYDTFSASHPAEARYLWQLAHGHAPPAAAFVEEGLRNLVMWRLVGTDGAITPLGQRLLNTRTDAAGSPARTDGSRSRSRVLDAYRVAIGALHEAYVTLAAEQREGPLPRELIDPLSREIDGAIVELAGSLDLLGEGTRGFRQTARQRIRKALGYTYP